MVIKQQLQVTEAVEMDTYGDQAAAASDCSLEMEACGDQAAAASDCSCRDGSLW